jgi:hypothetical protein
MDGAFFRDLGKNENGAQINLPSLYFSWALSPRLSKASVLLLN